MCRRPASRECWKSSMICAARDAGRCDGLGAHGPERGDPDGSGEGVPLVGEVEVEEAFAGAALTGVAILERIEGGVADEQRGVGGLEHGIEVGGVLDELRGSTCQRRAKRMRV
jgi:hypothetical protein